MTWGDYTRMNTKIHPIYHEKNIIKNEEYIIDLDEQTYNEYLFDFENKNVGNNFVNNWLKNNGENLLTSHIDFHGFDIKSTKFYLQYFRVNKHLYKFPIKIITGRGSHSNKHIKYDISSIILDKNDSTGLLENFVWKWLKQYHISFIKKPGFFILTK
jgi:hypothetical protein